MPMLDLIDLDGILMAFRGDLTDQDESIKHTHRRPV